MQILYADTPAELLTQVAQQMIAKGQEKVDSADNMQRRNDTLRAAGSPRKYRQRDIDVARALGQTMRLDGFYLLDNTQVLPTSERRLPEVPKLGEPLPVVPKLDL